MKLSAVVFSLAFSFSANAATLQCVSARESILVQANSSRDGVRLVRSSSGHRESRFFPRGAAYWQLDSDGTLIMLSVSQSSQNGYLVYLGEYTSGFRCKASAR